MKKQSKIITYEVKYGVNFVKKIVNILSDTPFTAPLILPLMIRIQKQDDEY